MKNVKFLLIALISPLFMWAQNGVNYQAVVRDATGNLLTNQAVVAGFQILEATATGAVVYEETHSVTTNDYGLINVVVGEGTVVSGDFTTIDWGANPHFLGISIDGISLGTIEFKTVPYSLHAQTLTNIKTNTAVADVEMTSSDEEATLSISPTSNFTNDSSTIYFKEGISSFGMKMTYNGIDNNLNINGVNGGILNGPHVSINRDSGISTFSRGIVVNETTNTPTPNTIYGNSGPIAYGFISTTGNITTDYGVNSINVVSTGVYEITLDNNFVGWPVVIGTTYNNTSDTEIVTYSTSSGGNVITIRIVDETNSPVASNVSFIVYGIAQ